jgi:hypothetical protein
MAERTPAWVRPSRPRRRETVTTDDSAPRRWWSFYLLVLGAGLGLAVVVYRAALLPAKFFYDGDRIRGIALGTASAFGDHSYQATGDLYRITGLAGKDLLVGIVGFAGLLLVVLIVRLRGTAAPRLTLEIATIITLFLGGVYLSWYSKDPVVLPITALIALPSSRRLRWDALAVLAMAAYAFEFRTYWALVAALYVVLRLLRVGRRGLRVTVLLALASTFVAGTVLLVALGVDPDHFRSVVNSARVGSADAQSAIQPFLLDPEPWSGFVNVCLTLLALVVPLPLAGNGGLYYLALAVLIAFLWIVFGRSLRRYAVGRTAEIPAAVSRSVALLVAYLAVQALFEPDYGSALRHITPLLPCLLVVLANPPGRNPEHRGRPARSRAGSVGARAGMARPSWLTPVAQDVEGAPPSPSPLITTEGPAAREQ